MDYEKEIKRLQKRVEILEDLLDKGCKQKEIPKFEFNDSEKVTCGKFTEDEKVILRNLPEEFKWIARDENGTLYITVRKPKKDKYGWLIYNGVNMFLFKNLFKSIQWEDEEPCEFRKFI